MPYEYRNLTPKQREELVARRLAQGFPLHGSTSFNWNREDGLSGNRKVWYRSSDRMIRGNEHYFRALNYIHYDPVKHGYVENAYEWEWSSLAMVQEDHGREWLREKWKNFPPQREYGEGWDEME